jgi:hypothetical protein
MVITLFNDIDLPGSQAEQRIRWQFPSRSEEGDGGKAMYIARAFGVGTVRWWDADCISGKGQADQGDVGI